MGLTSAHALVPWKVPVSVPWMVPATVHASVPLMVLMSVPLMAPVMVLLLGLLLDRLSDQVLDLPKVLPLQVAEDNRHNLAKSALTLEYSYLAPSVLPLADHLDHTLDR